MSKLRQKVLEWIRILGNNSGCHQRADRSFFYKGKQFPVCARCTGVFFGQIIAIILPFLHISITIPKAIFLLTIMGIDWSLQNFRLLTSTNTRRVFTGVLGGIGIFSLYIEIIKKIIKKLQN